MRLLITTFTLVATLLVTSCINLKPVADFGLSASVVASYQEVAKDYSLGLERQRLYGQTGSSVSDENIAKRKRDSKRLLEAQKVLETYAEALGALAADDLISYESQIDSLNKNLVAGKFATTEQIQGYNKAAKVGLKLFTDLYRRKKIKTIIRTYNSSLQTAVTQIVEIVEDGYLTGLSGESGMFTQLVAGRAKRSAEEKGLEGLPQLVNVLAQEHEAFLDQKEKNAKLLVEGLRKFGQGHEELKQLVETKNFKATAKIAQKYAQELRQVLKSFNH